jgi:hypothetical protein
LVSERKLTKAEAGALGGRARWAGHEARVLRLDALTPEQRRLVMALVDAARSAPPGTAPGQS